MKDENTGGKESFKDVKVTRRRFIRGAGNVGLASALSGLAFGTAIADQNKNGNDESHGAHDISLSPPNTEDFWNLFTDDHYANCLAWNHYQNNPILPPSGNTWKRTWTANPTFLVLNGKLLLYYRGHGFLTSTADVEQDRIGVAEVLGLNRNNLKYKDFPNNPVVGEGVASAGGSSGFGWALDPSAVYFDGKVWLYYSTFTARKEEIGIATSENGFHFNKVTSIPGRAPSVIVVGNKLYLLSHKPKGKSSEFYISVSTDGKHFEPLSSGPAFQGQKGSWDAKSVDTGRLSFHNGHFYVLYGGSSYHPDQPDYFGLARSRDLLKWERHPGNPIFGAGKRGEPDGAAIWFPALWHTESSYIMLYEGTPGPYNWELRSAICMSWISKRKKIKKAWLQEMPIAERVRRLASPPPRLAGGPGPAMARDLRPVTGTRIERTNIEMAQPITPISRQQIERSRAIMTTCATVRCRFWRRWTYTLARSLPRLSRVIAAENSLVCSSDWMATTPRGLKSESCWTITRPTLRKKPWPIWPRARAALNTFIRPSMALGSTWLNVRSQRWRVASFDTSGSPQILSTLTA